MVEKEKMFRVFWTRDRMSSQNSHQDKKKKKKDANTGTEKESRVKARERERKKIRTRSDLVLVVLRIWSPVWSSLQAKKDGWTKMERESRTCSQAGREKKSCTNLVRMTDGNSFCNHFLLLLLLVWISSSQVRSHVVLESGKSHFLLLSLSLSFFNRTS